MLNPGFVAHKATKKTSYIIIPQNILLKYAKRISFIPQ